MEIILLLARLALTGIFGLAGIGKLLDPEGSRNAAAEFGVPRVLVKPVAVLLPLTELALAVSLLFVETSWFGALGAGLLLLMFIAGMVFQMSKGRAPDCHCFGQIHSEPVSPKSLIRNAGFLLLSISLVFSGRSNQGTNIFANGFGPVKEDLMILIFVLAIILLLGIVIYLLRNISDQQNRLMRRMDVLELLANEGRDTDREDLANPYDGLPIGAPGPNFALPSVSGKQVEFEHLLIEAKPLFVFFVSPNCSPCAALVPEIADWKKELAGRAKFVFISSGTVAENREKFGETVSDILLQDDREVAVEFGATWTPTLLLINSDGTIGSHTAVGDTAIRELVKKFQESDLDQDKFFFTNGINKLQKSNFGKQIPEFAIEDVAGREISPEDFRGRKTLVTFWSQTCPHCLNMLDDLKEWDQQKGLDEPNLIVFSDGKKDDHEALGLKSPIILDADYEIAGEFGMSGTPSAVLVDEQGQIVSETAIGSAQIWALVGKKKPR